MNEFNRRSPEVTAEDAEDAATADTSDDASVVDYDDEGNPIGGAKVIAKEQYERIKPVQAQCVRFAHDAQQFFTALGEHPDLEVSCAASPDWSDLGAVVIDEPDDYELVQNRVRRTVATLKGAAR